MTCFSQWYATVKSDGKLKWRISLTCCIRVARIQAYVKLMSSDSKIPADANGEEVVYTKDTELFTDKTVTKCELPKSMVWYKDDVYNSLKDIGVDEGMLTLEKVWIKSRDSQGTEDVPAFLDDLSLVNEHQGLLVIEGLKFRSGNHFEKDNFIQESKSDSEVLGRQQSTRQRGTDDLKNGVSCPM
ncbi:hypothetical protein Cgig2_011723 [Carnegiea gigantea]|uniref:Uncharacterized protein n=1 Tax=Carnegiea gigantea TaxID=171969 RepID=A0A9Q1KI19_9CARY|nr:hypothetical protein Cgig2_011723 [Carnegiea gigantea]